MCIVTLYWYLWLIKHFPFSRVDGGQKPNHYKYLCTLYVCLLIVVCTLFSLQSFTVFPPRLRSTTSISVLATYNSLTQSTITMCSGWRKGSIGLLPQITSNRNIPKLKISMARVDFQVCMSSSEMYPNVPTTWVVYKFSLCSYRCASIKSLGFLLSYESSKIFLNLMHVCTTECSHSSCRYTKPVKTYFRTLYRWPHLNTLFDFPNIFLSTLLFGM